MFEIIPVIALEQFEQVAALADDIWREHYIPIVGKAQIDYMLDKFQSVAAVRDQVAAGGLYFLLVADGRPCGYFGVFPEPDHQRMFLSKFYVHKDCRGKGYARRALDFIEELSREQGLDRIALTVNKHNETSIAIYHRLGFETVGEVVTDIGHGFVMDDYRLEKTL
jgi:ribosomal protein S18 acetylase RimI-like enzyme